MQNTEVQKIELQKTELQKILTFIFWISGPLSQPSFKDQHFGAVQANLPDQNEQRYEHTCHPTNISEAAKSTNWGGVGGAGSNALNNSCRIHYMSPVDSHALKRSSRICWQLSMLLFDHTSASSPPSSSTSAKLHPDCCKKNLKISLQTSACFP